MPDWEQETRFPHAPLARELGVRSSAAVVVGPRDAPVGVLSGHSTSPGRVGEEDAAFMAAVANVARVRRRAPAVGGRGRRAVGGARPARRARARRRGPRAPRASPRRCTTARCRTCSRSGTTSRGCGRPPRATTTHLGRVRDGLARAVTQIREVMLDLHPVLLQVGGLESALRAICAQQARLGGLRVRRSRSSRRPPARRDELVLSLARELLRNAAKHARARAVAVRVALEDDGVVPRGHRRRRRLPGRPARATRSAGATSASPRAASARRRSAARSASARATTAGAGTQAVALLPARR